MSNKFFIDFLFRTGAFKFGKFKTKSGRISPYFINTGDFCTGKQLRTLASFYAGIIQDKIGENNFDIVFGPAYKGIAIAAATAMVLSINKDIKYCCNRKEPKEYGEGGSLIGAKINENDRVIIVDDVITSGKSIINSIELIKKYNVNIVGLVVSVDRQEKSGTSDTRSVLQKVSEDFNIKTYSITSVNEILNYKQSSINLELNSRIIEYRNKYGST